MLSARFDSEQEELTAKIKELEKSAIADKEQLSSIEHFAEQISGYAGITELNFKIINQLIEKILVSEPVEVDGQKIQRLTIHYKWVCQVKCVSFFDFFGGRVNRPPFCICN